MERSHQQIHQKTLGAKLEGGQEVNRYYTSDIASEALGEVARGKGKRLAEEYGGLKSCQVIDDIKASTLFQLIWGQFNWRSCLVHL